MIRAVIFDFFDVFRTDGYHRWLRRHGYELAGTFLDASDKHDRGVFSDQEFFQTLADISGGTVEQVEGEIKADVALNQSLVEYVGKLHGNYKLALLSNSASAYLRGELAKYNLEKYFDQIVISSEVGLIKPEPAAFELVVRKLAVQADECVFVDDNPRYVSAAEDMGIRGIVFTNTPAFIQDFEELVALQ